MTVDIGAFISELLAFYDFGGKTVLWVGAGGGQMAAFVRATKRVFAVDRDPIALDKLKESLASAGLERSVTLVQSDFLRTDLHVDTVLFEFCLHEMDDPEAALKHAGTLAPDTVVIDHRPGSEWSYYVGEEDKIAASWAALARFAPGKQAERKATHFFEKYDDLFQKLKGQGEKSLARIEKFKGRADIRIPMLYGFALVRL
jgi:SAM-dependent methyltransferase